MTDTSIIILAGMGAATILGSIFVVSLFDYKSKLPEMRKRKPRLLLTDGKSK